ncbi:MAG: FAD-linked oxidase C-terminal domain-containing protein, partial [Hyphomicrobiaceae bacterium]
TIGGMAANNSCGGRSLRYGTMRDNVLSIDATLADGRDAHFGLIAPDLSDVAEGAPHKALLHDMLALGAREADEIAARFPQVQRRVGGYNIDAFAPGKNQINAAHLLVGSEGTLAFSRAIELKLWPVIGAKALGVCHFGSFHAAMDAAQHLVKLKPIAVELVDHTLLGLAREIAMFRPTLDAFVRGEPEALLLVEFAEDQAENGRRLKQLAEVMGDLGFGWDRSGAHWGGVVEVFDPTLQAGIANVRTSGLNIMMSMKDARKPVSFVEDCAVPLPHLAEYTAKLTAVFEKYGTRGTWYAHASEGCLHVRPVLNLKLDADLKAMRGIAEEAFALVRSYKGSHSGEHGDGIVRSEFHAPMFGDRLVRAFEEVKDAFDPQGLLNPGKIVRAPKFDERLLLRYNEHYKVADVTPMLDWSEYPGASGGLQAAVEMCNNNGACRALQGGAMCPSYRVTRDERHVTRGRANTLRLALSGQLGKDGLDSPVVKDALQLCVSCKACKRECPTGVDMARLKIEALAARRAKFGLSARDRMVAYLPHYSRYASRVSWLLNLRDQVPGLATLSDALLGLSKTRTLPKWRRDVFDPIEMASGPVGGREVVLFADTFNRAFEREKLDAALKVLHAAGCRVHVAAPVDGDRRALCCGRTFLAVGAVKEARAEAERSLATLAPFAKRGVPIIGLEPSCVFSFRDEIPAMTHSDDARAVALQFKLIEEFLAADKAAAATLRAKLKPATRKAYLHGHCHQKAFGAMSAVESTLKLIPGQALETIESSCCGMAGAFGYQAETADASRAMAELSLIP